MNIQGVIILKKELNKWWAGTELKKIIVLHCQGLYAPVNLKIPLLFPLLLFQPESELVGNLSRQQENPDQNMHAPQKAHSLGWAGAARFLRELEP